MAVHRAATSAPAASLRHRRRFARGAARAGLAFIFAVSLIGSIPSLTRTVVLAADPVIAAAGDIACDPASSNFNGGNGDGVNCAQKATSNLLVNRGYSAVLSLGDNQYYCASLTAFQASYDPTWGRVKSITRPVVGNHEYLTNAGSTPATGCDPSNANAAGYFNYFGSLAGPAGKGWYSYDVGAWHLIALNSNCGDAGGCGPSSPQGKFLAADLAAHAKQCLLAYWHIPLFSSGGRAATNPQAFWDALYAAHADLILDGHDHIYERFAPQTNRGVADPANGILQITVGTGGANHTSIASIAANSVVRNTTSYGVLAVTLHGSSYNWKFNPSNGSFTDSGSATCHNAPTPTPTPTGSRTASPTPTGTSTAGPTPTPSPIPTPTPTAGGGGATTVVPVADSYVDASQPTVNFGSSTAIRMDGSPIVNGYLRFTVPSLSGTVTSATLRLFANSSQSTGYTAFRVADNSWGETTITASNAPPLGTALGSSGPVTAATWTSANVTAAVTGAGTVSFAVSTTSATALSLSSRTGANPPQLVITTSP
jgi:acid phosphatase type 7